MELLITTELLITDISGHGTLYGTCCDFDDVFKLNLQPFFFIVSMMPVLNNAKYPGTYTVKWLTKTLYIAPPRSTWHYEPSRFILGGVLFKHRR